MRTEDYRKACQEIAEIEVKRDVLIALLMVPQGLQISVLAKGDGVRDYVLWQDLEKSGAPLLMERVEVMCRAIKGGKIDRVVKVQRALSYGGAALGAKPPGFLVYSRGREHATIMDIPAEAKEALGIDLKGYFNAVWNASDKTWAIGKRVPDEAW